MSFEATDLKEFIFVLFYYRKINYISNIRFLGDSLHSSSFVCICVFVFPITTHFIPALSFPVRTRTGFSEFLICIIFII